MYFLCNFLLVLSLIIVRFSIDYFSAAESLIKETREHDFREMMRCYMKDEEFSGSNAYDCSKCGRKTELTIKHSKWQRIPPIFIIRANRFTNTNVNKILHKISIVDEFIPSQVFPPETFALKKKAVFVEEKNEPENMNEHIEQENKGQEENELQEEKKNQEDNITELVEENNEPENMNEHIEQENKGQEENELQEEKKNQEDDIEEINEGLIENKSSAKEQNFNLSEAENHEIPIENSPKNTETLKEFPKNNSLEESWNAKYALYCMIIHKGPTVKEGHYFVFVRDFQDNAWFCLDDSSVEKRDLEYDFSMDETPYVFFYMRRPD